MCRQDRQHLSDRRFVTLLIGGNRREALRPRANDERDGFGRRPRSEWHPCRRGRGLAGLAIEPRVRHAMLGRGEFIAVCSQPAHGGGAGEERVVVGAGWDRHSGEWRHRQAERLLGNQQRNGAVGSDALEDATPGRNWFGRRRRPAAHPAGLRTTRARGQDGQHPDEEDRAGPPDPGPRRDGRPDLRHDPSVLDHPSILAPSVADRALSTSRDAPKRRILGKTFPARHVES